MAAAVSASVSITDVVSFGDSASDNGNLFAATGIPPAPYWKGRFSNGPVWVEYLAGYLSNATLHDYAWGSSVANISDSISPYLNIPDLFTQLQIFENQTTLNYDTTLFTVFSGVNDIDYSANLGVVPNVAKIAGYVVEFAGDLIAGGAKHILVSNLPPLQLLPLARAYGDKFTPIFESLTLEFNAAIESGVAGLSAKNPSVTILVNDFFSLVNYTVSAGGAAALSFTDTVDPCFNSTAKTVCSNPDQYVFWDTLHPTTKSHDIIAQFSVNTLNGVDAFLLPTSSLTSVSASASTAVSMSSSTSASATPSTSTVAISYSSLPSSAAVYSAPQATATSANLNSGVEKLFVSAACALLSLVAL
ncbi:hypothetical protein HDU82_001497 [Entophlyctis luteolus]|nr:hypothetical protein HDU82_001497 [Entophlyctis luteolus]